MCHNVLPSPLDRISNLERSDALVKWEKDFAKKREKSLEAERQRRIEGREAAAKIRDVRLF